jgi:glycosyltransferase involved in cell wall biosynthesis
MITVVTPCHNQSEYLKEAMDSVLAQTYVDFEYLLLDDGSTDCTWDLMQDYAKKDRRIRCIKLPKQPNVGPVLNRSIQEMQGDFWVWVPSDDRVMDSLLTRKMAVSCSLEHRVVLYNNWVVVDEKGRHARDVELPDRTPEEFAELVWSKSPIGFTGIWIPRWVFDKTGVFPSHLQYSEDFYWMVKACADGIPFRGVPEFLVAKRVHGNRTTAKFGKKLERGMVRIWADVKEHLMQKDLG